MPRILFCCPTPVNPQLGTSKVYIEAAEGFRRIGWDVTVVGPEEVAGGPPGSFFTQPLHLRDYLRCRGSEFDVIEYEHNRLPFARSDFPDEPLMVARSVLLAHCVARATIPPKPSWRSRFGRCWRSWQDRRQWRKVIHQADLTLRNADLINLCNAAEREILTDLGYSTAKLHVLPFGLFPERLAVFDQNPSVLPQLPVVGIVGTFDPRKGMRDLPELFDRCVRRFPGVMFRMLGTAGMIPDADGVRRNFPKRLRHRLEIHPRFDPSQLPSLLNGVSVGVFPSAVEGFPFGVLEMLAAGIPVVAYDVPGPPEMLSPTDLVPVGAVKQMADRVIELLSNVDLLRTTRVQARKRAASFDWERIASETSRIYEGHHRLRAPLSRHAETGRS